MFDFLFGKKKARTLTIEGVDSPISLDGKETILKAALREGIRFPNDCRVGGCGTCKCRLVEGKVDELTESAYVLSAEDLEKGYVLACQSVPKTSVKIVVDRLETGAASHPVIQAKGTIARRRPLTHDIAELVVSLDRPITYTAGQYARLSVPSIGEADRSYSFARACPSGGTSEVSFFVREVPGGMLSPFLAKGACEGASVVVEGPFGDFRLHTSARPILAIAGGSGLAPIRALLEDAASTKCDRPVVFLFGARTQADLYEVDAIEAIRRSWSGPFVFVPVLSHEPADSAWQGARGLVTSQIEPHVDAGAEAYLCGPPPMIDAAIAELERFGLRADRIFFDKFLDQSHLAKKVA
ncbi:MAG: 2Fe-2S iron-sulfur cluster binding domain-containing protein [Polyangiales bacterium]